MIAVPGVGLPAQAIAFCLKHWVWGLVVALGIFASVQSGRLANAKHDQIDPATRIKWAVEERRDGPALAIATTNLATCQDNSATLRAAVDNASAHALALQAASESATARAAAALKLTLDDKATVQKKIDLLLAETRGSGICASTDDMIVRGIP